MKALLAELQRRNVLRAGALYIGALWALAQGIAQLGPSFGAPEWFTRWFVVAGAVGFPFWIAFAWFFAWTPSGFRRESAVAPDASVGHRTGRKLDLAIIAVLAVAVVLLLTDRFAARHEPSPAGDRSIAVLPLANSSGNKDEQFFSDGLTENLIVALSQFEGLTVIGRTSAFQFRDAKDDIRTIAGKLGVTYLLEGSVLHIGDEVRVSAELIDARNAHTLWSQRYDRPYRDLFQLQDDITNAVASALKTRLLTAGGAAPQSDRPASGNLDAYAAYMQGKFYAARGTEADYRRAIAEYTEAVRLDPGYASAWAQLARAQADLAGVFLDGVAARNAFAAGRAAAESALRLDPNLAAAHNARGYLYLVSEFDWNAAMAEYDRALQLAPEDGTALFNRGQLQAIFGRLPEAVALARRALATDPLRADWYKWLAHFLSASGQADEAKQAIRKAIELQPDASGSHEQLVIIEIQRGDYPAALAAARQESAGTWREMALALAQQISGDRAAADSALQTAIERDADVGGYQIAEAYAIRGDADKTFEWLERAWAKRDPGIAFLLHDPLLLRYRGDTRFAQLCSEVGLPQPPKQ